MRYLQKERGLTIYAYVILENHLHLIASGDRLSKTIKDFKSFTARQIIDYLESCKSVTTLSQLRAAKLPHKSESDYQVWQEGSHPQEIKDEKMLLQKIEYIHNNPVKRGYVDEPEHWRYSSARNYIGQAGLLEVSTEW
ncbi:MAG TPA: transposase [Bacteroidota bacterium]